MNEKNRSIKVLLVVIVCGLYLPMKSAMAIDLTIDITGEIYIPPCTVNNAQVIEVDFGDIPVTDVGNARFIQTKRVTMYCTWYQGTPYVKVIGTPLSGGRSNVLATNIRDFGIALYQGDSTATPLILGDGIFSGGTAFGYPVTLGIMGINSSAGIFTFTAAPYQQGGTALPIGAFNASANINISYL